MKTPLAAAPPRKPKVWTDRMLLDLHAEDERVELIDGKVFPMSPAHGDHSWACVRISSALDQHVRPRRLGLVFESSVGFRLDPGNVLSPDVSFSTYERLRRENADLDRFVSGVPNLAVEVISPSERRGKIRLKTEKYFARGTELLWLVYPRRKTVGVLTAPDTVTVLRLEAGDTLDRGAVLPGFRLPLAEVFEDPWFPLR